MRNNLAKLLAEAKSRGVNEGLTVSSLIILIALDNVIREKEIQVDESFFRDVEKEMSRIFAETMASVPKGEIEEMAERLEFYTDEIRERRKMDEAD